MFGTQSLCDAYLQYLVQYKAIDELQALNVLDQQKKDTPPIGRLALEQKILTMKQIFKVLAAQAEADLRFGEMAIAMGFMTHYDLLGLLETQSKRQPGVNQVIEKLGYCDDETLVTMRDEFLDQVEELVS
ncbi:MAG: hypothetical protein GY780_02175 [bacterium]|nr:hypothetical protein [bacterium]